MITTESSKQKNKNRNRLCRSQTCICMVLIQGSEKGFMKFTAVPAKKE